MYKKTHSQRADVWLKTSSGEYDMLEKARRCSFQQVRVKLEVEEERYAERSEENGRRRGGESETDNELKSLARPRE
jgi:hypothetical protein